MSAGEKDFKMEQGASFTKVITWTDGDDAAVDLSGYVVRFQAAIRQTSDSLVINLITGVNSEITISDAEAGEVTINIPGATTAGYTFFNAVYQMEAESSGGGVTRTMEGEITLGHEVV